MAAAPPAQPTEAGDTIESRLRKATALHDGLPLHPAPYRFRKLVGALAFAQRLLDQCGYSPSQLGVFAKDLGPGGAKEFIVDTVAGMAMKGSTGGPHNLYEIFAEMRPCWLYFDVEFAKACNEQIDPANVTASFYAEFSEFCTSVLGTSPGMDDIVELDASSSSKYSKHVIVKSLALTNNRRARIIVTKFVSWLRDRKSRCIGRASDLFVLHASGTETTVIDTSVYSRHRCFRLLWSSKWGQQRPLVMTKGPSESDPSWQMLQSMATFVPLHAPLFQHAMFAEEAPASQRPACQHPWGASGSGLQPGCVHAARLYKYLADFWDRTRAAAPDRASTAVTFGKRCAGARLTKIISHPCS